MADRVARYPYETAITAYGNDGFRFAEMSHKGSILCLPSGIYAWGTTTVEPLRVEDFDLLFELIEQPLIVLLGTGVTQIWPGQEIYAAFAKAGVGLEPMSTGAAARTYNILLAEKRPIAAALIAVP
jgi:uncharacterized protein